MKRLLFIKSDDRLSYSLLKDWDDRYNTVLMDGHTIDVEDAIADALLSAMPNNFELLVERLGKQGNVEVE